MKRILPSLVFILAFTAAHSQGNMSQNPIQWQYSAKKIADKTYEVPLTASLESGWHAYSQTQPEEAVAQPTAIRFKANPLVGMQGKIKEVGTMEKWQDVCTNRMCLPPKTDDFSIKVGQ